MSGELSINGSVEGVLCGGNLSILYSLLGSESSIDTENRILFIEDIDEYLYHIDRMMMNMKRNGKLDYIKGLLVGGMTDMKDNLVPYGLTAEEIIYSYFSTDSVPLWFEFPAGHILNNHAVIFGRKAKISISDGRASFYQE
jgi:muramoyltetrapeptide carboxypeptidase